MSSLLRVVFSALQLTSSSFHVPSSLVDDDVAPTKRIAIVGGGTAGLGVLKTILDVQRQAGAKWEIVLYEQRRDVGGVWLEDLNAPHPPDLPETPLYPLLHTNTPHPTMTYPNFTFPANTTLYPTHDYLRRYHASFAEHNALYPHIHLNHSVTAASWKGNATHGQWDVVVRASQRVSRPHWYPFYNRRHQESFEEVDQTFQYDHLIVGSGHNHYPRVPTWPGQEEWLAASSDRELLHSIFYRTPDKYAGRTVIVVGAGASGRDAALQIAPVAKKTFVSVSANKELPSFPFTTRKPRISHFTRDAVHFEDGTFSTDVSALVLATGYEVRVPFLSETPNPPLVVDVNATSSHNDRDHLPLTTNLRYIRPLYKQILSLSTSLPLTSLYFIGLPVSIANAPSSIAQSLFVAHTIANSSLLPSRLDLLSELEAQEDELRNQGLDPDVIGHQLVDIKGKGQPGSVSSDYQDDVVEFLHSRGVQHLPLHGGSKEKPAFVEWWRRWSRLTNDGPRVTTAWARVQALGKEEEAKWLRGRTTEQDWASLLFELAEWEKGQEVRL